MKRPVNYRDVLPVSYTNLLPIFTSAPNDPTCPIRVVPFMQETMFHPRTLQQAKSEYTNSRMIA